jgi:hypothetical protein
MKPYIFHDGGESIQDNIMECNPFSTKGTTKKDGSLLDLKG